MSGTPAATGHAPFVTQLRTRGETLDLAVGADDAFLIRGQVHEAWDAVRLRVSPRTTVAAVKVAALAALLGDGSDAAAYMAKVRGFEVRDESQPLDAVGVRAGSTVFVHGRRRRPIR
jgi:hypothetical protein